VVGNPVRGALVESEACFIKPKKVQKGSLVWGVRTFCVCSLGSSACGSNLDLGSWLAAGLDLLPPPEGWGALILASRKTLAVYCGKKFSIGHVTEQSAKQIPILNKKTTKKLRP